MLLAVTNSDVDVPAEDAIDLGAGCFDTAEHISGWQVATALAPGPA
jgi:hypothetical protein